MTGDVISHRPVRLDANATVACLPEANAAYWEAAADGSADRLEKARDTVAQELGCVPVQVIFTSGGTEANALGILQALPPVGKPHVVCSGIEHPAVRDTLARLVKDERVTLSVVAPAADGEVRPAAIAAQITDDTVLVALMYANNETGVVQPVQEVAALCAQRGVSFHCDAVQAVGKIPIDFTALGATSLALSGHKFGGPMGIGALITKSLSPRVEPLNDTANVPGAWAMATALRGSVTRQHPVREVRDQFEQELTRRLPCKVVAGSATRLANTSLVHFEGLEGDGLMMALDLEHIAVSTGSACSSGSIEPSEVLLSMGWTPAEAKQTVRFSFSPDLAPQELEQALSATGRAVASFNGNIAD